MLGITKKLPYRHTVHVERSKSSSGVRILDQVKVSRASRVVKFWKQVL